ncbi:MAG TPA: hypothetical protein VM940_16085 [Chthoniobacterales bacterium]|nr:hypothetical protein [Chthoniobacterales bacterium]
MNPHGDGKPEPADPEQLLRTLDLELMQQRALRQQIAARRNNLRALSFLFLFLVILGVAVATYFAFTSGRIEDLRVHHPSPPTATPATAHHP